MTDATAVLIAAVIAFGGLAFQLWQKYDDDRRQRWWDRTQWALSQLNGTSRERELGILLINRLLASKLATDDDRRTLAGVLEMYV